MIVPGGVDRSGTARVIPCLLWLLERISRHHDVQVFSMAVGTRPERYRLNGTSVHVVGGGKPRSVPTLLTLLREHRRQPFDVLHAFWVAGPGVVAAVAGKTLGRPVILHLPGGDLVSAPEIGYGGRRTMAGRARARIGLSGAALRTAPSEGTRQAAAALGYPVERVPLGVSRDAWPPVSPRARAPSAPARLVHVASLNRVKDQPTLLEAARRMLQAGADFTLDVAGEDTLGGEVQGLAASLGLRDRVRFHGFLPQERLRTLVAGADLMLLSSRHEGGPVVVAEAAMAGVPTVGTAVGMLTEWGPDAAVTVPVGDAAGLADAALDLLRNEDRRRGIAAAAQARALAEDADWSAGRVLGLYEDITR